jgi:hypothetical protein
MTASITYRRKLLFVRGRTAQPSRTAIMGLLRGLARKRPIVLAMDAALVASLNLGASEVAPAIAALAGCLLSYLAYKLFYRPDFGMPVRRRLLARRIRFRRDQFADAPMWWSDLQIQRAISGHWKRSLRDTVTRPGPPVAELTGHPPAASAWSEPGTDHRRVGR